MSLPAGTGSSADASSQRYLRRVDLWLILVLVVGFALRWQYVHLPIAEAHSWRQITNADIARNFTEESANILYPQVSWGGPKDAYVSMEFPLLQWMAGMLFHVVSGPRVRLPRTEHPVLDGHAGGHVWPGRQAVRRAHGPRGGLSAGDLPVVRVLRPDVHLRHADGLLLGRRDLGSGHLRPDP